MSLQKANLLLITFDQWRGDWTSNEQPIVNMPCLDEISKEGLIARRCYTSSPQCVPARLSWLTGLAPSQLGITRNWEAEVPADAPSTFRELQQAGWYTALIGKTHWTSHRQPGDLREKQELIKNLGFDEVNEVAGPRALRVMQCELTDQWKREGVFDSYLEDMNKRYQRGRTEEAWSVRPTVLPEHLYPDIWIANQGMQAIQAMPKNKPWLLWVSFVGPHEPFDTPNRWRNAYTDQLPKFTKRAEWIEELPINCELKRTARSWDNCLTDESIKSLRQDYANNLRLLDDQVRRLKVELEKRPDANNTALAITADHGEMLGDHEMLYKGTFLEGSIRIPLVYTPPKKSNAQEVIINKPIGLTNTLTTIIENLKKGGSINSLKRNCRQQNHVTIEFGDELLIIKNELKLCCNNKGEVLWGINLRTDPKEQINTLAINKELTTKNKRWALIYNIAQKEIKCRSKQGWIWRSLRKE